ncbi:allantoate amidohydrolase [Nocardioides marmoriginsengisoli]|uniref:Allantoate amidohydrolase n=1 Tax=Nocardioides marmoriginsengisoli TaxID=661483 RepID=A0A3N0CAI5_9ACTN|nr:allantoate amidohydrolase [Nocardioides marmoriginsengisoli]RNL60478.1 allantoate amidohydrolase [Nocardioides marmoriginsengisoli]
MPESFEQMWAALAPVGRSGVGGGYFRQPFASAERECHAWFVEQCAARGLRVQSDGNGNTVGWWEHAGASGPAVLTGSHLDSVLDGGAYDGPLGVVSALAAIDLLRERGIHPTRPIGVAAFAEEEGSRFGLACLGSRLAVGSVSADQARALRDRDGVRLEDAMSAQGLEPVLGRSDWLGDVGCYLELHVEQGRDLVDRDVAVGLASSIWPHGRYRFDFDGEANHAGSTAMADRHDPMLTFAMTALAANKQARLSASAAGARATFGRLDVGPNSTNAVPSSVTAWLDARCETEEELAGLVAAIERQGLDRAARDGTTLAVTAESVSPAVLFDTDLTRRLAALGTDRPVIATAAGHDAGVLAVAGIPSAMLFVRNPTGVSHSPAEFAETADCLAGVEALADALAELAS